MCLGKCGAGFLVRERVRETNGGYVEVMCGLMG